MDEVNSPGIVIGLIYRHPTNNSKLFVKKLNEIMEQQNKNNRPTRSIKETVSKRPKIETKTLDQPWLTYVYKAKTKTVCFKISQVQFRAKNISQKVC